MHTREWVEAIGEWLDWLKAAGRPATTRGLRRSQLMRAASELPRGPWQTRSKHLVRWLASHEWKAETIRSHRAALGSFYGWAVRAGRVAVDPTLELPAAAPGHHEPRPAPEPAIATGMLSSDERVALMVALAARQGLRRGELARMRTEDVQRAIGGWVLLVHGKGNRERTIPLVDDLAEAIRRRPAGWVFPGGDCGHLSPAWVGRLVSRALPVPWTCHTLRHRFGTVTYAGSRDLLAVQSLLGHAKPETTLRYVRVPDDAMRDALAHAS